MLKFNKAVRRVYLDVIAIHELRNVLKDNAYTNAFGDHATDVKMFTHTMVMAAGIQFVLDVKNKKGIKRILVNQTAAPVIVLGYKLYYSTEARRVVKGYLNK